MKALIIGGIAAFFLFIAIIGGAYWTSHNTLVKRDVACETTWAEIDNMLKRRSDLIPNLVNVVKGYAKHEKEVFTHIAEARAKLGSARGPKEKGIAPLCLFLPELSGGHRCRSPYRGWFGEHYQNLSNWMSQWP